MDLPFASLLGLARRIEVVLLLSGDHRSVGCDLDLRQQALGISCCIAQCNIATRTAQAVGALTLPYAWLSCEFIIGGRYRVPLKVIVILTVYLLSGLEIGQTRGVLFT